jgi:hypothetical protein
MGWYPYYRYLVRFIQETFAHRTVERQLHQMKNSLFDEIGTQWRSEAWGNQGMDVA